MRGVIAVAPRTLRAVSAAPRHPAASVTGGLPSSSSSADFLQRCGFSTAAPRRPGHGFFCTSRPAPDRRRNFFYPQTRSFASGQKPPAAPPAPPPPADSSPPPPATTLSRQQVASSWARTTSGNNLIDDAHRPVEDAWVRHVSAASGLVRRYPKVEEAKRMPKCWHELDNISLWVHCGPTGSHDANEERLIREIMAVKEVDYQTAVRELLEIQEVIIGGRSIFKHVGLLPYKAGMLLAGGFGVSTVPLIFHKDTVLWFNEHFVTADVPEPKDLETWLEVGSFAWQWMEPLIGQLSFLILVAQYMRNQLLNLGLKPYTGMLINYRCSRAVEKYPEYSETILMDYATTISWEGRRRAHEFGGTKRMARRRSIKRAK